MDKLCEGRSEWTPPVFNSELHRYAALDWDLIEITCLGISRVQLAFTQLTIRTIEIVVIELVAT